MTTPPTGDSTSKSFRTVLRSSRRALLLSATLALAQFVYAASYAPEGYERVDTQFIAALGDPGASSGTFSGPAQWGLWERDPGMYGVRLGDYAAKIASRKDRVVRSGGWTFDDDDWWLEEHGLIMEAPDYPMPAGKYLVTGDRTVKTVLTVGEASGKQGEQTWSLQEGTLYDVTHLPCRSARYRPSAKKSGTCLPSGANKQDFPVKPGAKMPAVTGCTDQDYAVIFLIGVEKEATVSR